MASLRQFLKQKSYQRTQLNYMITHHLEVKAILNGVEGSFIVDTGASNSCVGLDAAEKFDLSVTDSPIKAAGAGASEMLTKVARNNTIQIGTWHKKNIELILFDLTHVNTALITHKANPVDGIIGADILKKGKVIIDYQYKCMYLK